MGIVTAKAKIITKNEETGEETETDIPVEVEYDFGDNLNQLIENHGEDAVFHQAKSSMTVSLQSALRSWAQAGLQPEEINEKLGEWSVPTGRPRGKSRVDRFKENFSKLSDSEKADMLKELGMESA